MNRQATQVRKGNLSIRSIFIYRFLSLTVLIAFVIFFTGGIVHAVDLTLRVLPDRSFFLPGEPVTLTVPYTEAGTFEVQITYLDQIVAEWTQPVGEVWATLTWTPPPDAPRGYGVRVRVLDPSGAVAAEATSAFDVLEKWTQAPRYGYLSDFPARRSSSDEALVDWLLTHHIDGLQFYDWQYRWENLLPDTELFDDGLGRPQSMSTIDHLIDLARERGIAAMPYTAIYGASSAFARQHPDWALFDALGTPYSFGDDLITIMDPTPGSPWNQHLLAEFTDVLDHTDFDGIHIDQYGSPKNGFDQAGNPVDMAAVMPQFIDQTAEIVAAKRGDAGAVFFNCVGNWPVEAVAPAREDAVYIEVWSPYNDYLDLNRIITNAQHWGSGKPVILAAYIPPERTTNWRLANSVIFASGAFHIETGEPGTMLADPYFPKYGEIAEADLPAFARLYDFLVRYENVLSVGTTPAGNAREGALDLGEVKTRGIRSKGRVVPIMRAGDGFETLSLLNFAGIDASNWNEPTRTPPTPFETLDVRIPVTETVSAVWMASPDAESSMAASALAFTVEDGILHFTLPRLDVWDMIVIEYANA